MNFTKLAAAPILVVAGLACSVATAQDEVPDDVIAVAKGNNEFATDLYARLRSDKPANLFFSPYSISTALAMTYAGAEGETESQIAKVLHFSVPQAKLHPAFNALRDRLAPRDKSDVQLRVVNRLWGQQGYHFRPEFLQVTKSNYGAQLGQVDFKETDAARKTINSWIEEQTEKKIQDLLSPGVLTANTRLVLTNTIYFKARWMEQFSEKDTTDAPFHTSGSREVTAPMMRQTEDFRYGLAENMQLLELPYGGRNGLSMLILLPTKIDGLTDLEKRLASDNLRKWTAGMKLQTVNVHLPKFKMSSEFNLKETLETMGMPLAFSDKADFSRMSAQEQFFITAVIHKALVDVNEKGTEAAAVSAMQTFSDGPLEVPKPIEFRADHPSVFLILDNRTQSILFLGRLVNPKG